MNFEPDSSVHIFAGWGWVTREIALTECAPEPTSCAKARRIVLAVLNGLVGRRMAKYLVVISGRQSYTHRKSGASSVACSGLRRWSMTS